MKSLLNILGTILLATTAACTVESSEAEDSDLARAKKVEVSSVQAFSYDSSTTKMSLVYSAKGGCVNDHKTSSSLNLLPHGEGLFGPTGRASLQLIDETRVTKRTTCADVVFPEHDIVVNDLLVAAGADRNLQFYAITMPTAVVSVATRGTAEVAPPGSYDVEVLRSLSLSQSGVLKYAFGAGGGCGTHKTSIQVDLVEAGREVTAKVSVKHASQDSCEALIGVEGEAKLPSLLSAAFREKGLEVPSEVKVEFPPVEARFL